MFKRYYELKDDEPYSRSKVDLRNQINNIVLTGEQILESGIANPNEISGLSKEEIEELESEKERLQKSYDKLVKRVDVLKKSLIRESKKNHKIKGISQIERLIHGKSGPFVEEIQEVIDGIKSDYK